DLLPIIPVAHIGPWHDARVGWGHKRKRRRSITPTPNPSPQGGGEESARRAGRARQIATPQPSPRRGGRRTGARGAMRGWGGATDGTLKLKHPHPQPLPARGRGETRSQTAPPQPSPRRGGRRIGPRGAMRGWGGAAKETPALDHPHPQPLPARG